MEKRDFLIVGAQEPIATRLDDNSNVFKGIPPYFTPYGRDFIRGAGRGYSFPAYAVPILAASVKAAGASVACINDFYAEDPAVLAKTIAATKRGVFISTTFLTKRDSIARIVDFVRKAKPSLAVVLGGAGIINFPPARKLADSNVLYEGEETTTELVRVLCQGGDIRSVRGISLYRRGVEWFSPPRDAIKDLGKLALPYWEAVAAKVREERYLPIESSRGCVGKCSFCLERRYWPGVRFYPVGRVIRELKKGLSRFGVRHYYFQDSNISNNRRYLEELCTAMRQERLDLIWSCESRIDTISRELVDHMYRAGCRAITFGMESADPRVLRNMNKAMTAERMRVFAAVVRHMRRRGMIANVNVIVGFPGEDAKSVRRTIDFLRQARPITYSMSKFFLERGTDVWKRRREFALEGSMHDWKHATMKSDGLDRIIRQIFLAVSKDGDIYHWTSASVDLIRHMAKRKSLSQFVHYLRAVNRICVEDFLVRGEARSMAYDSNFRIISKYLG